jgi:hypothetical protein
MMLIIFGGIGLLMVIGAFFLWKRSKNLLANGIKTEGTVIDLIGRRGSKGGTTYTPQVGFKAMDGREITFMGHVGSNPPSFQVGQIVPVVYLPNNPEKAAINAFWDLWGAATIIGGMGVMFLVISALSYWAV